VIDDQQSERRILGVEDDDFLDLRKGAIEGDASLVSWIIAISRVCGRVRSGYFVPEAIMP